MAPASPSTDLRLSLLQGFDLRVAGRPVSLPGSAQRLVAFLALQPRPLARTFVAGRLWPDATEEHSLASLRSALWRTRRCADGLVEIRDDRLGLGGAVAVDRHRLVEAALRVVDGDLGGRDGSEALALGHELLPGWDDDWVLFERERLRHLRLHAMEALVRGLAAGGRYAEAADVGLMLISVEPLRESAHHALIDVHLAEGNVVEARRQFELCRRLLRSGLGVPPSARLVALLEPAAA